MDSIQTRESLVTWSQVWLVLAIIVALILVWIAFIEFGEARNQFNEVARAAYNVFGWAYLVAAGLTVAGGFFLRTILTWMVTVSDSVDSVNRNLTALASNPAETSKQSPPVRRQTARTHQPANTAFTGARASTVPAPGVRDGPHAVDAGWGEYHCSECKRSLPHQSVIPRFCPHCEAVFQ